jgi:hypothetical protein
MSEEPERTWVERIVIALAICALAVITFLLLSAIFL